MRTPTEQDIPALVEFQRARMASVGITATYSEAQLRAEWTDPGFDRARQVMVAEQDGQIVGHHAFWVVGDQARGSGFVAEPFRRNGIGSALLGWFVQAARSNARVRAIHTAAYSVDAGAEALIERHGFTYARTFLRMLNERPAGIAEPEWPDGVRLVELRGEALIDAVMDAHDNSFIDHWNFIPSRREEWEHQMNDPDADPSMWFVALGKDDGVAGFCINWLDLDGVVRCGDLGPIGTTRAYRGIGLGRALLRHSVRALARKGATEVVLGVDSDNPNGAVRLYTSNGFRQTHENRVYVLGA